MKFPSLVELFSSFLKRRQATRRPERWKRRYGARNSPPIEALESRILLTADLLEPNDSWQTATDIGIAPGIHLTQVSLHTATDQDWFRFELLRADDLKIQLNFNATAGSAGFDLFSSTANSPGATPLASSSPNSTGAGTSLAGLPVGSYFVHVVGAGTAVDYALAIDPATTSSTRVFYVNDASTTNDFYSLAAGSASNSGLTPGSPKGTIQQVLDNYIVGPNDLVLVDTGTYTTAVQATANDEGTTYAGSPGGSRLNATFEMIDSDFNLLYRLQFGGSGTGVYLHGSSVDPTTDTDLRRLTFLSSSIAIQIDGGDHNLIENSVIFGSGNYGLYMPVGGQAIVRGNTISQRSYGVFLNQGFNATLENNDLSASNFAVYGVGVYPNSASSSLDLTGNRIHGATFGVYRDWGLTTATQNEFLGNQTGFYAALGGANAALFGNSVHNNGTGLQGYGRFGGTDWSTGQANDVFSNGIGIHPADSQSVSFNRVRENVVGIQGENLGGIHHNILDGNTTAGILVSGAHDVSITNNTIHTTSGVGVKLQQSARNVSLRNNILSTDSGIGLYVATDSQQGFASDYNNHFAAGSGTPIWWEKPFGDVYDWQVEADLDLHSIGMTTLHPNLDNPLFVNPQGGDFHLQEASTSLDAGDPADLFNLEPGTNGGRVDLGAYGNTDQATESVGRYVRIEYPEYYTDWPEAVGRTILWRTYDSSATNRQVSGFVKIELFQAGIGKVADIATVPASDGSFGWSPQASGIPGTNGNRYWIQISSIDHPETVDQSREQFSIPTTGGNYYVNDASVAAGDITSAAGNNRNTGRSPQDPKANLLPLLRAYDLGPGDVVNIDAGDYIHVRNVTLSGNLTLSDDEGMTLTGPVDPNRVARLDRANPFAGASNIELDDGDYVTLEHLTLVGANLGVWAHNGSTNFQGRHLVVANNTQDGLRLESDSDGSQLDDLTAVDNGRTGIWVSTPIASLSNSVSHGNSEYGIFLQNAGDVHVENNEVYANNTGISVSNFGSGTSVIGNADLDAARGNRVHDNRQIGIAAQGSVSVVGNTVARQSTVNGIGMDITQGATARLNVVFDNTIGINSTSSAGNGAGAIDANRVFHNSTSGIRINFGTPVRQNVVYSNAIGIEGVAAYYGRYSGVVANNIVYANTTAGIRVEGAGAQIVNNTAYQPTGNAVSVELNSTNVSLRNNILWAMAGYDIAVDGTSQSGFASDFNVLQTSGAGKVALWQGAVRPSLTAWQNTIFQDANSLAHDPLFVDPVGADGVLGYNSTLHLDSGTDDDFHEQSDFGSCHGGSLAPVLSATTGLPGHLTATWVNDSQRSPGIDRGDSSDPFANEPASNGRFINLGGFGNTAQASHSPSEYMLVTRPDGGEIWPAKQTVPIRWRSHDFAGTVDIELWQVGGSTPTATIADNTPNSGEFLWLIPQATPAATNYFVKIVRNDNSLLLDQSNAPFEIAPPVSVYYVNDNSTAGDEYSTTIGDNGNTGLLPNSPKASIAAILAAYDVGPGDVIRVDTGTYVLDGNLVLRSKDSGVRIEGPQTGTAILNRGNSASGSYVVELAGADDVTISHLSLTGARDGIFAGSSSDSDRVTISQNRIYSNVDANIAIYASNDQISIIGNSVWNSTSNGASSTGITINNAASALVVGNDVYNNGTGIYASGPSLTTATQIEVRDNQVHNNSSIGIDAQHQVVVIGNSVWGQANVGSTGIRLAQPGSSAQGNSVFDNYVGFDSSSQGTSTGAIQSNRVFHNVAAGIRGYSNTLIDGNAIYGNSIGIETFKSAYVAPYIGTISHNLVYGNTNQGIRVEGNGAQVVNNTVYHLVGNAVQVETNSTNITLRNNILSVVAGGAISVNPNSEVGFSSDYNDIVLGVSGKIGRWENRDFASFADWRFDVGQDAHSQVRDPQFTDVNGFDDILGFDTSLVAGSTRVIDDGASGFSLTGSWTSVATGNQGNSVETAVSSSGGKLATWTFSGLDPNAWYEVATTWPSRSTAISDARYTLTDQQVTLATVSVNQRTSPGDFADGGVNWARLGTYLVRGSTLTVQLSNLTNASGTVSADAVRIQKLSGDHGSDDNFVPQANSPTIDAGDPATVVLGELSPNGARVNQGHTGNTPSALNSNVQQIQVLSPNGGDKIEAGQPVTVAWQSAGLSLQQPVVLLNVGGGAIGDWRANAYQTATYGTQSFTNSVDRGFVIDPAPESVYQTYAYNPAGVGSKLAWHIPTSDGTYAVRLHFVEPSYTGVGQRKFDVKLQGNTIAANFDVYAAAGARYKATVLNSTISAAGGTGIDLELVNVTSSGAILSGIELLRPNSTGVAAPTADVDLSVDGGATWTNLAAGVSMDRFGRGQYAWTPTAESVQAIIRVRGNQGSQPTDTSDTPFLIVNGGQDYYVNDTDTAGDLFTTAVGNNLNSGKSPDRPMANLAALIDAYDLDAGDVVHVDNGSYAVVRNISLGSQDSGVRIEGPALGAAVLNRGNTTTGSYVIELAGADDVTLTRLAVTGAADGIHAGTNSGSDRAIITANTSFGNLGNGIEVETASALVVGNDVYNNGTGIYAYGPSLTTATQIEVRDNQVHNNSSIGIDARYQVVVIGNSVWGQANVGSTGIRLAQPESSAQGNSVFDNYVGFDSGNQGTGTGPIQSNRVFHNAAAGIRGYYNTLIDGNVVYGNSIGIETFKSVYSTTYIGTISHNLVYGNTNQGIRLEGSGAQVVNNTVYQLVGNAVQVETNSTNITLQNNILSVMAGRAISVNPNSEVGFSSDYNDIVLGVSGNIGRWENRDFASFADWRFDVGQDAHSQVRDPQFTDANGFDDILGFDTSLITGSTREIDDGSSGFALTGSWTSVATGNQGDSVETAVSSSGGKLATWTFSGLDPNAWYEVATTWPSRSTAISDARYTLADQQVTLATVSVNQRTIPGDVTDGGVSWARLGTYFVRGNTLTVQLSNLSNSNGTVSADAVRIQKLSGDHGSDDNFVPQATSPTSDAGDPATAVWSEVSPNGARVNQGHTGNAPSALNSNVQQIQVLSPNGMDKVETGQPMTVAWQSAGLSLQQPVVLLNVGGVAIGDWRANAYQTVTWGFNSFSNSIDRASVLDPAPEGVYQTYAYSPSGIGSKLAWHIPAGDGSYTVRLHFAEPSFTSAGQRKFDVKLQGNTVAANFDVYAATGARYKATVLNSTISAAGGTGIDLELVNVTSSGAILSGIELLRPNSTGVAAPTADVDLSVDGGATWTNLAAGVSMDRFGRGQYAWTPAVESVQAIIRVRGNHGSQPTDTSDTPFLIVNGGQDYYVNDTDTAGDLFTTAMGNNLNSGKSPDRPMASLAALIDAYDLDAGDVVHVDNGSYAVVRNISLGSQDSGVRIEGPALGVAVLNRGNTTTGSYVIELAAADDVTISRLTLTGAVCGVFGSSTSDSDRFTLVDSRIYSNSEYDIALATSNDEAIISRNTVSNGTDLPCIDIHGNRSVVAENDVSGGSTGIYVSANSVTLADQIVVSNNRVHNSRDRAIFGEGQVLIVGNTVWGQTTSTGIEVGPGSKALNNTVFDNKVGIGSSIYNTGTATIEGNRVYRNSQSGIRATFSAVVRGNVVYSNSTGIDGALGYYSTNRFTGLIASNLVYANANTGIRVDASGAQVFNNTVYQSVGNAVLTEDSSSNVSIRNNILWVDAGYDLYVSSNSQSGFSSDNNVLFAGSDPNAHVAFWGNTTRDEISDWRLASSQDAHSSAANPNFVDVDGADNTLGYSTLGTGYNGGTDDNFYQARLSPAIDAADAWSAPATDILGLSRVDDSGVPNTGSGDYRPTQLGSNGFAVGGTAQGWRSNNTYFNLSFPAGFVFPFYRQSYTSVTVSTEGLLYFSGTMNPGSGTNSTATLQANRIIAPLWDNLSTSGVGDDIFVDTSIAGRLTVRWNATNEANNSDVNFSVTLFDDGTVQFNYGAGNTGLSPTIGISRGDGQFYQLSPLDAQAALTNSNSVKFSLTPGVTFADIGAYEFRGNSNDAVPPQVVATMPAFIESNGTSGMVVSQISVAFSEEVNAIDANAPANYELRRAVNGIFGDGDDVVYSVTPSYAFNLANSTSITTLDVGNGGAPLPGDTYRLTVHGNAGSSIHDTAGNRLDGNRDGVVTGSLADEYVRTFVILPPGINVSTISGPTTEVGGTATFSMVLNSQPTSDVTIPLSSNDLTEGTLSPANLTFTPANWNVPQSVTVTGVNDAVDDGDVPFAIVIGSAQSADARYNGLRPSNVAVVNTDDDTAGVGVSTISRSTTEAGGTATFTVVLTSEPTANVAIALASSDLTEGVVNKANLVFTPSNWNIPQFVTVTGVDDAVDDGDVGYAIVTSAAVSADPIYSDLNPADVSVVTLDDDTSGFTVSPISRHTTESAGTATFTVVLNSEPTANVSISLATTDTTEGSINKSELIFTPANWNSPQQVTVFGVNDAVDDGDVAFTITLAPATSTDPCYNGIDPADVDVTNDDDDTAGITVSTISGNPTEAGGIATFSLVLTSEPTASVTIGIASNDLTEATVNKTTLTFTPTNWNIPQVLTVTGVDDLVDDGDVGFLILTNAAVSGDASYSGLNATDVSVTTIDDDTASVLVSAISGMTTEAGGTATFSLVLGSQPTAAVTIGLTSDDLTEGVLSVGSVTFTPANWNVAQLVTVSGVDDAVADGDVSFSILTSPATSTDPVYSGIDPADISVINLDDDQLPNDAPTLAGAATLIYTEQQATVPAINAGVTVADVDNLALTSATIRITANYLAGEDLIEFTSATTTGNITAQFDSGTGTLTLDSAGATATIAQFQAALARVTYRNTSSNPSTAPRSVEYRVSDGTLWSNRLVNLVTIVAVNDLPVLAGSSTLNYTEKQTATVINPTITVSDSDSSGLAWATVAISTNFATGQDLLEFVPDGTTGNLAGTYNATSGVLTLISTDRTATPAQVQSALQRVTYRNSSANPTLLTRSVSFKVSDGIGQSATSISTIAITPTNDAPTLSGASTLIYAKNQVATAVNAAITVADVDNTTFTSATVRIAVGYSSGNDLLEFTPTTATGNVVGAYDVDTGTMTLTSPGGTATAAQFQAALARVTYRNTSGTPTVAPRSVEYQIFDATLGSNVITSLITIKGTGPAPTLATGGSRGYTELQAPVVINPSVVVADTDSATLAWATVKISTNFAAGQDQLSFAGSGATGNIQGAYNAKTGILTLISAGATATKSEFQSALRQVTYSNSSANPSKLTRSITFQVCDGTTASNSLVNSIAFTALNDAPVLMGLSGLIFTENQAATPAMNAGIVVSDVDNLTLASATVRFATNYLPGEDVLGFVAGTTTGNIVAAFDTNTGVLTLSSAGATATIAQFQAALRLVTYRNTSATPSILPRAVEYQVSDGLLGSNIVTSMVTVVPVNNAPTVAGVNTLGYTENQPALAINPSISLSDSDHTRLASATVKISANFSTAQDLLEFFGNAMTGNIVGNYNLRTGVLSLISEGATATPAQFEAALRRVTYRNLSDAPTTLTRSISFQASDGITLSNIVIGTITITPVNDAPILSGANAIAYATSQAATAINPTILVADIDNTTQSTATVRIATNYVAGEDLLAFTGTTATGNITGSFDSGTGTMTLTSVGSTATKAQFQAALRLITYRNTSLHPALAARTVEYQISDGFLLSNRVTCLVTIKVAGAAPVLSGGSTLSYKEKQPAKIVNSAITVADSDSASLAWATVKLSSGFAAGQDVLDFAGDATTGNITGSYNASTGILLLISAGASATKAQFQAALRLVTYRNSSLNPSKANRSVAYQISDGTNLSNTVTSTITVG